MKSLVFGKKKFKFILRMLSSRINRRNVCCPYCYSSLSMLLQRKKIIIEARKCHYCGLIFRCPTDLLWNSQKFYENSYEGQQATDIPPQLDLENLKIEHFRNSKWNKSKRFKLFETVSKTNARLLDFGSSWGYAAYQYKERLGFDVFGYEIDARRGEFGKKNLGIPYYSDAHQISEEKKFDVIISDHTLEHVINLYDALDLFERMLTPDGRLILIVPNGSGLSARKEGVRWGPYIGEVHLYAFTIEWFVKNMPRHGFECQFFDSHGNALIRKDYLFNGEEITLIAAKK